MTPAEVGGLTPGELFVMTDGLDWASDREWERALVPRLDLKELRALVGRSYPRFRQAAVVVVYSGRRDGPVPGKATFGS